MRAWHNKIGTDVRDHTVGANAATLLAQDPIAAPLRCDEYWCQGQSSPPDRIGAKIVSTLALFGAVAFVFLAVSRYKREINWDRFPFFFIAHLTASFCCSWTIPCRSKLGALLERNAPWPRSHRLEGIAKTICKKTASSAAAQFRQKPLLGKAQPPFSFNALKYFTGDDPETR